MDITRNAIWTHDCQGKQDLDFGIIQAFTRYYPDHSAICSMELCPDEAGGGITLCESDIMHGHSEGEIKQMVREWYNAHILDAFKKAIEELGIVMGLKDYTTEELKAELKRRAAEEKPKKEECVMRCRMCKH